MSIEAERKAFEAWGHSIAETQHPRRQGEYSDDGWQFAWLAWQARAALDTAAPAEPVAVFINAREGIRAERPMWVEQRKPYTDVFTLYGLFPLTTPPAPEAQALTAERMLAIFREVVQGDTLRLTRESGPYDITEPTHAAEMLVRAIEREVLAAQP